MRVYKITPGEGCNSYCENNIKSAIDGIETQLRESEGEGTIKITILEMTRDEYDSLPEYMGP